MQSIARTCRFSGCSRSIDSCGLCKSHHQQLLRKKELRPLRARRPKGSPPLVAYQEQPCPVPGLEGPCHVYLGCKTKKGYGRISVDGGKSAWVHRYVWERDVGPIPTGMLIDHQCRVRACCNVRHLRVVNHQISAIENNTSPIAINAQKTHCPQGHPYNQEHTGYAKGNGRYCRTCRREKAKARRERARGGVMASM